MCENSQTLGQMVAPGREPKRNERGAAMVMVMMIMLLVAVISASVLAFVSSEGGVAGGDLQRTRTFYAAQSGLERMTNGFSSLFTRTSNPTDADLNRVAADYPTALYYEGFNFDQQFIQRGARSEVVIKDGPFAGLNASVVPYTLTSTVKNRQTDTEVGLQREINNYLIPMFQFGIFSDEDLEFHPGPPFYFNGRIHANGNLYLHGDDLTFLSKVTTANEIVTTHLRNGVPRASNVKIKVGTTPVRLTLGSVSGGPNLPVAQQIDGRGNFPGHPAGSANTPWDTTSIASADGTDNQFAKQVLTRTTGAKPLLLPLQLGGAPTREIIKRRVPGEEVPNQVLSQSRFHTKATIRILIDDENPTGGVDTQGIPAGRGVTLSAFVPSALNGGRALARIDDDGNYLAADLASPVRQKQAPPPAAATFQNATTVRGVQARPYFNNSTGPTNPGTPASGVRIPPGAGITGRILIEIVPPAGNPIDVTQEILSMGVTQGEPNGIIYLQRPLWASYVQGSRDRNAVNNINHVYLTDSFSTPVRHDTRAVVDGEIADLAVPTFRGRLDVTTGHYTVANNNFDDDPHSVATPFMPTGGPIREASPCPPAPQPDSDCMNRIVPINLYNVREGGITSALLIDQVYERGITSVVDVNMRNLARWVAGTYDNNLLAGTQAVSANIDAPDGYIVYVSDRRGDKLRNQNGVTATNGIVDNEDIYGGNGADGAPCSTSQDQGGCDRGEDVNTDGILRRDLTELPDPAVFSPGDIFVRSNNVASWSNIDPADATQRRSRFFRRAVRLFNAENLQIDGPRDALTETRGITMSTENMVFTWGNYNTTGIVAQPVGGSTLNDGGYTGPQVPASIVADAFFPLSKTWFDSSSALYPQGGNRRPADAALVGDINGTAVRTGIIAGNNQSALAADPSAGNGGAADERRLSGGMHNYPRFLENWGNIRWNFVGSLIPLYRSTQAVGPYNAHGGIYGAPIRNWAFDITFTDPTRLPPGTPLFQYIESTGFKQLFR